MRATIWGSRGSLAAPGPETVRYGGNTSCIEVSVGDGRLIILDGGTGIRGLGLSLRERPPSRIDILLSHLHIDHVEGLGFFSPMWEPGVEIHLWAPAEPPLSLLERLSTYLSPPLFPVRLDQARSHVFFHDVPEAPWQLGAVRVAASPVRHVGPTVGYRLEGPDGTLTYISDHEPAFGIDVATADPAGVSGRNLARRSDVLFHDAQYTEEEYEDRMGWGHSSVAHTVWFGRISQVRRLFMFHHDPLHSDAELEAMLLRAKELWGDAPGSPTLAAEGMTVEVSRPPRGVE